MKSRAGRTLTRLHARLSIFEGGGSDMRVNAATAACRCLPFKVLMPILNMLCLVSAHIVSNSTAPRKSAAKNIPRWTGAALSIDARCSMDRARQFYGLATTRPSSAAKRTSMAADQHWRIHASIRAYAKVEEPCRYLHSRLRSDSSPAMRSSATDGPNGEVAAS